MLQATAQLPFSAKIVSPSRPPPKRASSSEREYLRPTEVNAMIRAAKKVGRHGLRDWLLYSNGEILVAKAQRYRRRGFYRSIEPKVLKAVRRQFGIANGVLNVTMP